MKVVTQTVFEVLSLAGDIVDEMQLLLLDQKRDESAVPDVLVPEIHLEQGLVPVPLDLAVCSPRNRVLLHVQTLDYLVGDQDLLGGNALVAEPFPRVCAEVEVPSPEETLPQL